MSSNLIFHFNKVCKLQVKKNNKVTWASEKETSVKNSLSYRKQTSQLGDSRARCQRLHVRSPQAQTLNPLTLSVVVLGEAALGVIESWGWSPPEGDLCPYETDAVRNCPLCSGTWGPGDGHPYVNQEVGTARHGVFQRSLHNCEKWTSTDFDWKNKTPKNSNSSKALKSDLL